MEALLYSFEPISVVVNDEGRVLLVESDGLPAILALFAILDVLNETTKLSNCQVLDFVANFEHRNSLNSPRIATEIIEMIRSVRSRNLVVYTLNEVFCNRMCYITFAGQVVSDIISEIERFLEHTFCFGLPARPNRPDTDLNFVSQRLS
jgi:hypothetical protein